MTEKLSTIYGELDRNRNTHLESAYECAQLTIPAQLPRRFEGSTEPTIKPAHQSLGASAVKKLASKILMALFPPNEAFFKLTLPKSFMEENQLAEADVESGLQDVTLRIIGKLEDQNIRSIMSEAILQLIIVGDVLIYAPIKERMTLYKLDEFVIERDHKGDVTRIVIKELRSPNKFKAEELIAYGIKPDSKDDVKIYTGVFYENGRVRSYQEINDFVVDGSESNVPEDKSPYIPLRWQNVSGSSYSISIVEEYKGDLMSYDNFSMSVNNLAKIASKIIFLVRPNALTDPTDLAEAKSGEFVTGDPEDITPFQLEKFNDFKILDVVMAKIEQRINQAFLITTGSIRNAERVTREEVRMIAEELEDVLGGIYTVLSHELQSRLIQRVMAVMTRSGELPSFGAVKLKPTILTGFDALGRNHLANKLRSLFADLQQIGGDAVLSEFRPSSIIKAFANSYGISQAVSEMLLTDDEKAAMQEQQNTDNLVASTVPDIVKEAVKQ